MSFIFRNSSWRIQALWLLLLSWLGYFFHRIKWEMTKSDSISKLYLPVISKFGQITIMSINLRVLIHIRNCSEIVGLHVWVFGETRIWRQTSSETQAGGTRTHGTTEHRQTVERAEGPQNPIHSTKWWRPKEISRQLACQASKVSEHSRTAAKKDLGWLIFLRQY